MKLFLMVMSIITPFMGNAYVLLQVRKGDNQSNVDALIHKVVPSTNIEKLTETARKQFDSYKQHYPKKSNNDERLESIVVAINSGASSDDAKHDVFDRIFRKLSSFVQDGAKKFIPKYRAHLEKLHIKPQIVHFKSGKPSVIFEVNVKEIMRSIQEFLTSKEVKTYADKLANKAAIMYRAFKEEIMQS